MFLMWMMEPDGVYAGGPFCVSSMKEGEKRKNKSVAKTDKYENHLMSISQARVGTRSAQSRLCIEF